MTRGFVYLFAVMDWSSRRALSWRLSNTLTTDFCMEQLKRPSTAMVYQRSSTPTKGASSPALSLLVS
jgi:hypothetical protein